MRLLSQDVSIIHMSLSYLRDILSDKQCTYKYLPDMGNRGKAGCYVCTFWGGRVHTQKGQGGTPHHSALREIHIWKSPTFEN